MHLFKLNDTVLNLKGNAANFLQGLTANSLDQPFNAFLNLHGRIVSTFRQQIVSDNEILIIVPSLAVEGLLKHLERYAKISGIQIGRPPVYAYIDIDSAQLVLKDKEIFSQVHQEEFILFRLNNNLPLLGVDYQLDEFILNIDEVTFVSFTKGCFLGQEPVSKVHNRSKPTRKLVVKFEEECIDEDKITMTSKIKDPQAGRVKGFIFVKNT